MVSKLFFFPNQKLNHFMKGISSQLDSLSDLLKKNINNKELLKSKDNFEIVYQKITQEAFKTIHVIIQNFNDDFTLKLSYSSFLKQLKTFLSFKPDQNEDEQDQFFSKQFDEVQQFMNNRKPVMPDMDTGQRGDIYKFLYQAENKSKDIEEFIGNADKFNLKGNKNFGLTNHKWKKTLKNLSIITQDIDTQTDINLQFFETIQKKLPNLFKLPSSHMKSNDPNYNDPKSKDQNSILNFEDMIEGILNEKLQERKKDLQEQKKIIQKQEKQKQAEQKKKDIQKKKKKPADPNRRNSQLNLKRNSVQGPSAVSLKGKSQFNSKKITLPTENNEKSVQLGQIAEVTTKKSIFQNNADQKVNTYKNQTNESIYQKKTTGQKNIGDYLPPIENLLKTISSSQNFNGISEQQIKEIYQIFKKQISMASPKNFPLKQILQSESNNQFYGQNCLNILQKQRTFSKKNKNTCDKQTNTELLASLQVQKSIKNTQKNQDSRNKFFSKKSNKSQAVNQNQTMQNQYSSNTQNFKKKHHSKKNKNSETSKYQSKTQNSPQFQSQENTAHAQNNFDSVNPKDNDYEKENDNQKQNYQTKHGLPQIYKTDAQKLKKLQKQSFQEESRKQITQNDHNSKYSKDIKQMTSPQNIKTFNKENYTLDMYKSKEFAMKNRVSDNVNLPSLNKKYNKPHNSMHEQGDQFRKSPYLKKIGKKNTVHQSSGDHLGLFQKFDCFENNGEIRRQKTNNSYHDQKDEERIMNELEKISRQGSVKLNMKSIAMYINYVESIHIRRCGQKCIHLERFYGFLQRNNIPNRKELSMHKADMNLNVNI